MRDYRHLAQLAARAATDKKANNVVVYDLRQQSDITDYVIIAGADSSPQLTALESHIEDELRKAGAKPLHRDGPRRGRWTALDYGALVIHLMLPEARELYRLEHLWENPKRVAFEKPEPPPSVSKKKSRVPAKPATKKKRPASRRSKR